MKTFYQQRYFGWGLWVVMAIVAAVAALVPRGSAPSPWPWAAPLLAVLLAASLGTMTVTVDRRAVRLRATIGWPRTTVPLDRIVHAEQVTGLLWRSGYGIHWGPRRTLWNLTGNRGVVLQLTRGGRVFIGTPEPEALLRAIARARHRSATEKDG